jgi:hypothetical protein
VTRACENEVEVEYDNGEIGKGKNKFYKLATCNPINTVVSKIMGVKESFIVGITPEPQKTYRKAGITNGDGLLTEDGAKIYLTYLLGKDATFKADVADGIVAELEKQK